MTLPRTPRASLAALAGAALLLPGCGGDGPTEPRNEGGGTPELSIEPREARITAIDDTQDFDANLTDADGTSLPDARATWSSTDTEVASVDSDGVATALRAGFANVVASFEGVTDTVSLRVDPETTSLTVSPASDSVAGNGGTTQLSAETLDRNGNPVTDRSVLWVSSDTTVAVVDRSGLVTGRKLGEAEVSAESNGVADTAGIVVFDPPGNDPPVVNITAPPDGSSHGTQETIDFSGTADDLEDGSLTGPSLVWRSDLDGEFGTGAEVSTSALTSGDHRISLTATDGDGASAADTVRISVLEGVNLLVERIDVSARGVLETETVGIGAVVRNEGVAPAGGFDWALRVDGTLEATGRIDGVAAGDTATIPELTGLGPLPAGPHDVTLELDTGGEVSEADEDDNTGSDLIQSYPPGFDIELDFVTSVDSVIRDVFLQAEDRWEGVITGDLPDVPFSEPQDFEFCATGAGVRSSPVDDMLIYVRVDSIDGLFGVLGFASPCFVRLTSAGGDIVSTVAGRMVFDEADLGLLQLNGDLEATILHEMGHVLGIGSLWSPQDLVAREGSFDPVYTGAAGRQRFLEVGGDAYSGEPVPVANIGGPGTRDVHWRESVFDDELMTGFLNAGGNPLSAVSVGSLRDQFLPVDISQADAYQLPLGSSLRTGGGVDLGADVLLGPIYGVTPRGTVERVDPRQLRTPE